MDLGLARKTAEIAGGSKGIGLGMTRAFAVKGARRRCARDGRTC